MKNLKAIAILITICVIGLVGGYLSHVIDYGKEVDSLNEDFSRASWRVKETGQTINKTLSPRTLESAIRSSGETIAELDRIRENFKRLTQQANFVRNTWQKTSFTDEQVIQLREQIQATLNTVSERSKVILASVVKNTTDELALVSSRQQVEAKIDNVEKDIQVIVKSLSAVSSNSEELNRHKGTVLGTAGPALSAMADTAVSVLASIHKSETNSARQALQKSNSVQDAVKIANTHLGALKSGETLLRRVALFKPSGTLMEKEFAQIKQDASETNALLGVVKRVVRAQKTANTRLEAAIKKMDSANGQLQRLERYAPSSVINNVYASWDKAVVQVASAKSALKMPAGLKGLERDLWSNCNSRAQSNIDRIYQNAAKHRDFVRDKYREARRDESTMQGSVTRSTQRGLDRFKRWAGQAVNEFSNSRMGREIGVSAKMLVLGTKAFYDLQNPNTDVMTWAMSYEGDVNKLMKEVEDIERMDQPSLTGKNTFIEGLLDQAYERSFSN